MKNGKSLIQNAKTLGQQYEDGQLNEGDKWFMDEARVGKNRRLLKDFLEMATKNADTGSASICFLISLTQLSDKGGKFQLKLLSSGETLVDDFSAPKKIWKLKYPTQPLCFIMFVAHQHIQPRDQGHLHLTGPRGPPIIIEPPLFKKPRPFHPKIPVAKQTLNKSKVSP